MTVPNRRDFLRAGSASAGAGLLLDARSYAAIVGSNDRLGIAFLGCGARAQAHLHRVRQLQEAGEAVHVAGVCDVWDGLDDEYTQQRGATSTRRRYSQGLFPSARKAGLDPADANRVTRDYRRLLDRKDVDAVCIATPDHWHGRMTLDALDAHKHVLVERPLAHTPEEIRAIRQRMSQSDRVLTVGVQQLTVPDWHLAREQIRTGRIGAVTQASGGAFRNDSRGQWRYTRVPPNLTPATVDWANFLGPDVPHIPFHSQLFAQWRCDARLSTGLLADGFLVPLTRILAATGWQNPTRVVASGGLYLERDGRTVPDVAALIVEFAEGGQIVLQGATTSAYPVEEVIRGRRGAIRFTDSALERFADSPDQSTGLPARLDRRIHAAETIPFTAPSNQTEALWRDFLGCIRQCSQATVSPLEPNATAALIVALAARDLVKQV
jgi:predicted dehydrogenase